MTVEQSQIPGAFKNHPELFEIHPNGKVVVAGHRVPVFVIMEVLEDLHDSDGPLEQLQSRFPSIEAHRVQTVKEFLDEHWEELREFYVAEKHLAEQVFRDLEKTRTGPTREELRKRRKKRFESE